MLAVAFLVVAYPTFREPDAASHPADTLASQSLELLAQRDATYAILKELDLDLEMEKLTPSDYQALSNRYRAQAVAILRELDSCQASATKDEIEHDVTAGRQPQRDPTLCLGCGSVIEAADSFCRRCGAALHCEQT
jgi:hypothetical protein